MREIKFRAWDRGSKVMHSWETITTKWDETELVWLFVPSMKKSEQMIVMQYTGLKDKNGKEIYEGDILEVTSQDTKHLDKKWRRMFVDFDRGHFRFNAVGEEGKEYGLFYKLETWKPKIIGNIYENPDLLKV
jgi:uncharacterized phage protein (TIGR01671 family)